MKQEDIQDLQQLIEFLKEHSVAEFELEREDVKVAIAGTVAAGLWL